MKKMLENKKQDLEIIFEQYKLSENDIKQNMHKNNSNLESKFSQYEEWVKDTKSKMDEVNVLVDERFKKMEETVEKKKKEYKTKIKGNFSQMNQDLKRVQKERDIALEMNEERESFWKHLVSYINENVNKEILWKQIKENSGRFFFCLKTRIRRR